MMISIIVPVFNVESYIDECIQSVIKQTYSDWELLLVNDGSTDMSGIICERYAEIDGRIKVIHKENKGVSDTRNWGLNIALGEYIIFLDSDDYWYETTALSQLVDTAEKYKLDIIRGEYKAVDHNGNNLFERTITKSKLDYSERILSPGIFYTKIMSGENFLVLSLIRRKSIDALRFNSNRIFLEDMEFFTYFLLQPLRCMFIPIRFYAYRKISTSASHTPRIKNLIDSFSMCDVFNKCSKEAVDDILKDAYKYNSVMMYYWTLDTMSYTPYYENREKFIKELSLINLNERVVKWAISINKAFPISIYFSPILGLFFLRIKHMVGRLLKSMKILL